MPRTLAYMGTALVVLILCIHRFLITYPVSNNDSPTQVITNDDEGSPSHAKNLDAGISGVDGSGERAGPIMSDATLPAELDVNEDSRPVPQAGHVSELDLLKATITKSQIKHQVRYKRICIKPVFSAGVDRNIIKNISTVLLDDLVTLDIDTVASNSLPPCQNIQLAVTPPYEASDVSHLIFGIATRFERLEGLVKTFAHWLSGLPGSRAKLIALINDFTPGLAMRVATLQRHFQDAGMDVTIVKALDHSHTMSQSHLAVLRYMLEHSSPKTHWFGLLDDDTFFPRGLSPLSGALGNLSHRKHMYVGALSEDGEAVARYGSMAFGGAGIFLSTPLARTLGTHLDECVRGRQSTQGDIIIRDCVNQNSKARLTILNDLFQHDIWGDASGFFEAGPLPLTIHHWKTWYREPVLSMAAITKYCGDCFLQRWRFGADTVFSNGYSINKYRDGTEHLDLQMMEGTWAQASDDFAPRLGPLRSRLSSHEKKSYKLVDVISDGYCHFRQLYAWRAAQDADEMDEIIEMDWRINGQA